MSRTAGYASGTAGNCESNGGKSHVAGYGNSASVLVVLVVRVGTCSTFRGLPGFPGFRGIRGVCRM